MECQISTDAEVNKRNVRYHGKYRSHRLPVVNMVILWGPAVILGFWVMRSIGRSRTIAITITSVDCFHR